MAKKEVKTNVMRILDTEGITYQEHTYDISDDLIDGVSVAQKCGEDPEQVFKTLIPVKEKLDLKACARAVGVKSVAMLPQKELLKTTGYVHGGCSPIGMKKLFVTVYDETIVLFDTILISGGKVGTQIEIAPDDIIKITEGKIAGLTQ